MRAARSANERRRQARNVCAARAIRASSSASEISSMRASTSPVAGFTEDIVAMRALLSWGLARR
jgi:hypothetical protein